MFDNFDPKSIKVALLSGGTSGEREISLASGDGAQAALTAAGYDVTRLDPAERSDLRRLLDEDFDIAFLTLHGKGGEDGSMQGFLETIGLPYTGSDVWGSAVAMDKSKAKVFYDVSGVPTAPHTTVTRSQWNVIKNDGKEISRISAEVGPHCVAKVANEGSSLGVYFATDEATLRSALESAFEVGDPVVVERYIAGDEFTVVVLGAADSARALPIIQIIPQNDSYDFESKYAPGGSKHVCPAPLDDATTSRMQELAVQAHNALECYGVSRTDFILDSDGAAWALETNTLPGMTETSLLPDAARAAGIEFPDLCTMLIKSALERKK